MPILAKPTLYIKPGCPWCEEALSYFKKQGVDLAGLSLSTLQGACHVIEEDVFGFLTVTGSVNARNHPGGTAPSQVRAAVAAARERLQ